MRRCLLSVLLCGASLLGGCGNVKVQLTTGLSSDELFRIGDVSCRMPEALIWLMNQKNRYEEVYGIEMWEHAIGGTTMEDYLKDQTLSQLAQVKSMVLLAGEREIALTEEETAGAEAAAEEYFASLMEEERTALAADTETICGLYEDYALACRAYDQITEEESVEVSDDDARIIRLQQIFVQEQGEADDLLARLEAGEDFETLAAEYSTATETELEIARGEKSAEYEETAYALAGDETSGVFAADGGYYILKCLDPYVEEASEENKLLVAQQQQTERFQEIYEELMADTVSEIKEKLWEDVRFEDYGDVTTSSFFEIYEKYFADAGE